jgi:tRNA A-37 threonylcarbamoyl transferase component Bud32
VTFDHLDLIVKFGPQVSVVEAICLWAVKRILHDKVPVPEVYGWRIDGDTVFIYMQLIRGDLLQDRWDSLNDFEKTVVCDQLRQIATDLQKVEQEPSDPFIGM